MTEDVEVSPRSPPGLLTITVGVVSYGRPDHLRRCLTAVFGQTRAPDRVLVGLRPGDTASHMACAPFTDDLEVVPVGPGGQVAALNAVLHACRTAAIAFVDDDAVAVPEWLARIERWFVENHDVGAVGGRDIVHHGDTIDGGRTRVVGHVGRTGRLYGRHHWQAPVQEAMFLKGANMAFRRDAIAGFDPRLRGAGAQVCNDLDASLGTFRRGWRVVYDPAVAVDHFPAARMDDDQRDHRSPSALCAHQHNELYVLLKHQPGWQLPVIVLHRIAVGYRRAPGPVMVIATFLMSRRAADDPVGWPMVVQLTAARLAAVGSWLRYRRSEGNC